jgi:outer membrane immunogenic protein
MRLRIKTTIALLLTVAAVSAGTAAAQNPAASATSSGITRAELTLGYTYLHSNAPPGGCGCFNLNGGSADFAWAIKPGSWDLVGDVVGGYASGVSAAGYGLTLTAYTGGVRYLPPMGHSSFQPFGQVLAGVAHSSGTLVQGSQSATANAGAAFAANFGGGLDLRVNHRFSVRLVEADYLLTTFDNGTNNHQNNLRISAGVVVHF